MNLDEFKNSIPLFLAQAVDTGNNINGAVLSTSLESIYELDNVVEYLSHLRNKGLIDDNVSWNVSVSLGVLLGEMIIREHGFHWSMSDNGIPIVETEDGNQLSPITKIHKIITSEDGGNGSPSGFYNGFRALQQYYEMTDEERDMITTYIEDDV